MPIAPGSPRPTAGDPLRTFLAGEPEAGVRLDRALQGWAPDLSRTRLQGLVAGGHVEVDGRPARRSLRLRPGMRVTVRVPAPAPLALLPEPIPLDVVFEDQAVLVVNKPAGLVVHPGAGHTSGTLVHALLAHAGPSLSGIGGVERPGIVHRLDRGTSGLLVVAKTDRAHTSLTRALQARTVERRYVALVHGRVPHAEGLIDLPVGRHPTERTRMAVRPAGAGRSATTRYAVRERFGRPVSLTLLDLRLGTGRTHQIRVHLSHLGHPVVGDPVYRRRSTPPSPPALAERVAALEGQALHAARLAFVHPETGQPLAFEAPWPAPLAALVEWLRAENLAPPREPGPPGSSSRKRMLR